LLATSPTCTLDEYGVVKLLVWAWLLLGNAKEGSHLKGKRNPATGVLIADAGFLKTSIKGILPALSHRFKASRLQKSLFFDIAESSGNEPKSNR